MSKNTPPNYVANSHGMIVSKDNDGKWIAWNPEDVARHLTDLERQLAEARELLDADDSDSPVAACNCSTKSPELKFHKRGCKYRLIVERDEAREARKVSARDSADMVQNASKREGAAKRERDEARQQRDRLAEACRMCERYLERHENEPSDDSTDDSGWMVLCGVRSALASLERKEEGTPPGPVTPA